MKNVIFKFMNNKKYTKKMNIFNKKLKKNKNREFKKVKFNNSEINGELCYDINIIKDDTAIIYATEKFDRHLIRNNNIHRRKLTKSDSTDDNIYENKLNEDNNFYNKNTYKKNQPLFFDRLFYFMLICYEFFLNLWKSIMKL